MQTVIDVRISENGRLLMPKWVREALGVAAGGVVVLSVEGNEVRLNPMRKSVMRAQDLYRAHVTDDLSSDAFLDERRREARDDVATDPAT